MLDSISWSVMIPTYNCAGFLKETLLSVLSQDPGSNKMQIEVIDDCSSDNPESVVDEVGNGRVTFFRQEKNVGHVKNFDTAINRAKGKVIHLLHGDDFVSDGFYEEMRTMYDTHPQIGACFCRHFYVNQDSDITGISGLLLNNNGIIEDFFSKQLIKQNIQTPSITVKNEVYEKLGTFNPNLSWSEDWEMWTRIAKHYDVGFIKKPLASYRIHSSSSTGNKIKTGENVKDLIRLKTILLDYASANSKRHISVEINRIIAARAMNNFKELNGSDKKHELLNLKFALQYHPSLLMKILILRKYLMKII